MSILSGARAGLSTTRTPECHSTRSTLGYLRATCAAAGTRRVQLVRRDGRDVSTLYGREGRGGGAQVPTLRRPWGCPSPAGGGIVAPARAPARPSRTQGARAPPARATPARPSCSRYGTQNAAARACAPRRAARQRAAAASPGRRAVRWVELGGTPAGRGQAPARSRPVGSPARMARPAAGSRAAPCLHGPRRAQSASASRVGSQELACGCGREQDAGRRGVGFAPSFSFGP